MAIISHHPLLYAFFCVIFISLPQWAQAVWGLFSKDPLLPLLYEKLKLMKIPNFSVQWIVNVIALSMFIYICIIVKSPPIPNTSLPGAPNTNTVVLTITNFVTADPNSIIIQEPDTNCEADFQYNHDSEKLENFVIAQFEARKYSYCILAFQRLKEDYPSPNEGWRVHLPLLAASYLAENPTSEGFEAYYKALSDYTESVQQQANYKNGQIFGSPSTAINGIMSSDFDLIETVLPIEEKPKTEQILKQIQSIVSSD